MISKGFGQFAGLCAILAGLLGLLYAVSFIVLQNTLLSGFSLAVGGLLATAALTALFHRVREVDPSLALWALGLVIFAALGSAIHGGYDLANAIHPPVSPNTDLPNAIDPRGLLTFGVSGIGMLAIAWLTGRATGLPKGLSYLGYALGSLSVILYLGRLVAQSPSNPLIFVPALLAGFIAYPAWYVWTGIVLWRGGPDTS
jgi:hypothetical protein